MKKYNISNREPDMCAYEALVYSAKLNRRNFTENHFRDLVINKLNFSADELMRVCELQ